MRIAILEDDPDQAALVIATLEEAGHACIHFERGGDLLRALQRDGYDLMILDWLLPDIQGDEVLRRIRERLDWPVPVLFVTRRDSEEDVVHALQCGADDYMAKPVGPRELLARVAALARRAGAAEPAQRSLQLGEITLDLEGHGCTVSGQAVTLTDTEFRLAAFILRQPGRLLARNHLLESVWGRSTEVETRTVDVHVSRLRRKLKLSRTGPWVLRSVYQQGYRLEPAAA